MEMEIEIFYQSRNIEISRKAKIILTLLLLLLLLFINFYFTLIFLNISKYQVLEAVVPSVDSFDESDLWPDQ